MNRKSIFLTGLLVAILIGSRFAHAENRLKVAFLDIGQGDAIYIEAPNGNQMIIDGGPGNALRDALAEVMPYGDKSINVLIVTNTDADHYSGFISLIRDYDIGAVIEPGTVTKTATYKKLKKVINEQEIPNIIARNGMTIDLDKENEVSFRVLFPDRDVTRWSTNDGSIMGILSYGETKVMFTGDGTKKTENAVLANNKGEILRSDILKVGHHGSATSSGDAFVRTVSPTWAVISAGLKNSYGLPKKVTLDTLLKNKAEILRTDELGTITFLSDGNQFLLDN